MNLCRILVDSLADKDLTNAQMANAREIIRRLDSARFHVSVFHVNEPDQGILSRSNTRLICLPKRRQSFRIAAEFLGGKHQILFYVKSAPASRLYLNLRNRWKDDRIIIGTIESRSDLRNEPTITPAAVHLWEQTVLRCDYLFSNSDAVAASLKTEYGLNSQVVPTGVDTKFFSPAWDRLPNLRPRVLYAGSLRPFKQPQFVLDAAARFPQADFVLAGEGLMETDLRERIARERLRNVMLTGLLRPAELKQQYCQADIFLFPSTWEGSPKVILEAAACGLPVIACKDYHPETVLDSETGFLAGSNDEILARLQQLLADEHLRTTLGRAGRKHSEKFDWDVICRQWEEIFLRVSQPRSWSCVA